MHADLESQTCLWEPAEPDMMLCDRLDAMCWGLTDLFIEELKAPVVGISGAGRRKSRLNR